VSLTLVSASAYGGRLMMSAYYLHCTIDFCVVVFVACLTLLSDLRGWTWGKPQEH